MSTLFALEARSSFMTSRLFSGRRFMFPVAALLFVFLPRTARCDFMATTLADLEMGGAVQVGPLSFSDFDYTTMGPDMPLAASVTVSPVNRGNQGQFGLLFTSSWSNPTPNGAVETALIRYKV